MLRAIIFDFNGLIINDEPLHFSAMRDVVASFGIALTKEEYWNKYLPMDDNQCLEAICRDYSLRLDNGQREQALTNKAQLYEQMLKNQFPLFPGVAQFVQAAAEQYSLALASGARRKEIVTTLEATGLIRYFLVIIAGEDFAKGKPHPESFLEALERLNDKIDRQLPPILPEECLVIEDSVNSVQGARAAGMYCIAVSNTYPSESLQAANLVVASLEEITIDNLKSLFGE